jgi:hypothetical protein
MTRDLVLFAIGWVGAVLLRLLRRLRGDGKRAPRPWHEECDRCT